MKEDKENLCGEIASYERLPTSVNRKAILATLYMKRQQLCHLVSSRLKHPIKLKNMTVVLTCQEAKLVKLQETRRELDTEYAALYARITDINGAIESGAAAVARASR